MHHQQMQSRLDIVTECSLLGDDDEGAEGDEGRRREDASRKEDDSRSVEPSALVRRGLRAEMMLSPPRLTAVLAILEELRDSRAEIGGY